MHFHVQNLCWKVKEDCSFSPPVWPYFDVAITVAEQREGFVRFAQWVSGMQVDVAI